MNKHTIHINALNYVKQKSTMYFLNYVMFRNNI